jgi:hypothetical protein
MWSYRFLSIILVVVSPLVARTVAAQQSGGTATTAPTIDTFTAHYWAQISPNFDYLNGCSTGYRAFIFTADGYFIYNQRVHGAWRIDQQGNLVLRTKQGQVLRLFWDHSKTLTPSTSSSTTTTSAPSGNANFRHGDKFQQCTS